MSLQALGNFHAVVPGEVYRSAQPTPQQLATYTAAYEIKTVINLRGDSTGIGWYDAEKAETARLGIAHIDFRMNSGKLLGRARTEELAEILRTAQKPLLIHCKAGSDRTGLASAIYLAAVKGVDVEEAEAQLSVRYGHLSVPFSPTYAMDETYEDVETWLGYPDS